MNQEPIRDEIPPFQKKKMNGCLMATIIVIIVAVLTVGGCFLIGGAAVKQQAEKESGKLESLANANPSGLQPTGELADYFNPGSDYTNIQRDNKQKEIKGQIVDWNLLVYEVSKTGEKYEIQTRSSSEEVAAMVKVTPRSREEAAFIEGLKTNDRFRFKGYIEGISLITRHIEIEPAILINPDYSSSNNAGTTAAERKVAQALAQGERELKQSVEEAQAIRKAIGLDKEVAVDHVIQQEAKPLNTFNVTTPEALQTATLSNLSPYDKKSLQDWNSHAGEIVEWRLNVRDVQRVPNKTNTYLLKTGHEWEIPCEVELVSITESLNTVIEGISPNTSIAIRGQLVGSKNSNLLIGPAILRSEHLSSSIIKKIETLSKTSEKGLDLSEIKADIKPDLKRTTIQQENITRRLNTLKGSLVQGTFTNYSAEPTSSGCVLVQYDGQSLKQRNEPDCIIIFSPVKSKEAMEQLLPIITSGKPIAFRGYIAEVKSGMIQIDPAILLPPATVSIAPKEIKTLQPEAGQTSVADAPATDAESAAVPAMPGERYPETRLQLLGPADLMDLNLNDVRYAINEMYARHGAVFKNAEIAKDFANKEWFKPRPGVSFGEIEKEFSAIEADNLKLLGKEREREEATADLYELIDSESNLRDGPGTNYPIVRKSRKGEVGEALSNKKGWMKLQFSDGSMAWAHEYNLKAAK